MTMVLIAATCSLRAFRFGNVQLNALGGIAAGFAFFVLAEVSRNFAMAGLTSAMAAAWVPVIIAASSRAHRALVTKRTGDDARQQITHAHAPG